MGKPATRIYMYLSFSLITGYTLSVLISIFNDLWRLEYQEAAQRPRPLPPGTDLLQIYAVLSSAALDLA